MLNIISSFATSSFILIYQTVPKSKARRSQLNYFNHKKILDFELPSHTHWNSDLLAHNRYRGAVTIKNGGNVLHRGRARCICVHVACFTSWRSWNDLTKRSFAYLHHHQQRQVLHDQVFWGCWSVMEKSKVEKTAYDSISTHAAIFFSEALIFGLASFLLFFFRFFVPFSYNVNHHLQ